MNDRRARLPLPTVALRMHLAYVQRTRVSPRATHKMWAPRQRHAQRTGHAEDAAEPGATHAPHLSALAPCVARPRPITMHRARARGVSLPSPTAVSPSRSRLLSCADRAMKTAWRASAAALGSGPIAKRRARRARLSAAPCLRLATRPAQGVTHRPPRAPSSAPRLPSSLFRRCALCAVLGGRRAEPTRAEASRGGRLPAKRPTPLSPELPPRPRGPSPPPQSPPPRARAAADPSSAEPPAPRRRGGRRSSQPSASLALSPRPSVSSLDAASSVCACVLPLHKRRAARACYSKLPSVRFLARRFSFFAWAFDLPAPPPAV